MSNNINLIDLSFKKFLMKLNVLNYLFKENIISEDVYKKSIVQINKLHNKQIL